MKDKKKDKNFNSFRSCINLDDFLSISTDKKPFLVAEVGLNHNKDIVLAKETIAAFKEAGADAIKFQSYTTDEFIYKDAPHIKNLYNIFSRYELPLEEFTILKEYADSQNICLFSTPLSLDWVTKLDSLDCKIFKIASGDINNFQLIEKVISCKKPILFSTGASTTKNIDALLLFLKKNNFDNMALLHCVSLYPTPLEKTNLTRITFLQQKIQGLVGFSDHSNSYEASMLATLLGACVIEKHVTLDKTLEGPDHSISLTPKEFSILREKINIAFTIKKNFREDSLLEEFENDYFGKRSLYQINNTTKALRPRQKDLPKDSDYKS